MSNAADISGYSYSSAEGAHTRAYLWEPVLNELKTMSWGGARRVFDLGCGNGATAAFLEKKGFDVTGVDPSTEGIKTANENHPHLDLHEGSAYDNLKERFGTFPALISLEVVEHVYDPRLYATRVYDLLEPGGKAIISTPYHGYLKNVAIAITGNYDLHHNPLWDHGHIKFWSMDTLSTLLQEAGFVDMRFLRVGRSIPALAKSMIAIAHKPA